MKAAISPMIPSVIGSHRRSQPRVADPGQFNYSNGAAVDRPTYRYYVGPVGALGFVDGFTPPKSGVQGTFDLNYNNPGNTAWISEPAQFGQVTYVGGRTRQEVVSRGGVIQSSFLDNRIVFVGGLRKDFNRTRSTSGASINTTTGLYDYGNSNNVWGELDECHGQDTHAESRRKTAALDRPDGRPVGQLRAATARDRPYDDVLPTPTATARIWASSSRFTATSCTSGSRPTRTRSIMAGVRTRRSGAGFSASSPPPVPL